MMTRRIGVLLLRAAGVEGAMAVDVDDCVAPRKPGVRERWLDGAMIVLVVALFCQGFVPNFKSYRAQDIFDLQSFLWPCITGVSFLSVYYPFRWGYRFVWTAAAPIFVLAIPLLGFEIKQRLHVASGEERWEGTGLSDLAIIHLALVSSWATFRFMTISRLRRDVLSAWRNSFGLSDSMRFTAGVSVIFAGCSYFPPSSFDVMGQWVLTFFLCYGLCIVAMLSFRPQYALLLAIGGFVVTLMKKWSEWSIQSVEWADVEERFVPWAIFMLALFLARKSGYRMRFVDRDRKLTRPVEDDSARVGVTT